MTGEERVVWQGQSGEQYSYWVFDIDETFDKAPGNYIFAMRRDNNTWRALYVGQTKDLSERLTDSHEKKRCAVRLGATHIHAHANKNGEAARLKEEGDLIRGMAPRCNEQGL